MLKTLCITFAAMLLLAIYWHIATPAPPPPIFLLGNLPSIQIPLNRTPLDILGVGLFTAVFGLMAFEPKSVKLLDHMNWTKWAYGGFLASIIPVLITGLLTLPLMIPPLSVVLSLGWSYERNETSVGTAGKFETYFRHVTISIFGCGLGCGALYGYLTGFLIAIFGTVMHELVGGATRAIVQRRRTAQEVTDEA